MSTTFYRIVLVIVDTTIDLANKIFIYRQVYILKVYAHESEKRFCIFTEKDIRYNLGRAINTTGNHSSSKRTAERVPNSTLHYFV